MRIAQNHLVLYIFAFIFATNLSAGETKIRLKETPKGGDFTLKTKSTKFVLSSLKGTVVLLYFGFTSCPDICPNTLSYMGKAIASLSPEPKKKVKGLFVSVDPERDTPENIKKYAEYFNSSILAYTGSVDEIQKAVSLYGGYFRKIPLKSEMGYTIDHSTSIFLIDQNGNFVKAIPHGTSAQNIKNEVMNLLK